METVSQERSRLRGMVRLLAVMAILAAGYAGMQLAPISHATASAAQHGQLVIECPTAGAHCP